MQLTVVGSADDAGIPVHGCLCTLCRQARAVRHLRRKPFTLLLQHQGEQLLLDAGAGDIERQLLQEPVDAVLLSSWEPPNWRGLLPVHLGAGPETPVLGPARPDQDIWFQRQPGRLLAHPVLEAGRETLAGRFRIHSFDLGDDAGSLAYGIRNGEHRLVYLPRYATYDDLSLQPVARWQPDAVIIACPPEGSPKQRLDTLQALHARLGQAVLLVTGLDHHMDQWLRQQSPELPPSICITHDDQRLATAYLAEYRRLASGA
jgi:phosphoribosyl 1,2-cyclic phosphate phosphodiesterase